MIERKCKQCGSDNKKRGQLIVSDGNWACKSCGASLLTTEDHNRILIERRNSMTLDEYMRFARLRG
jgi:ribosomal protein L37AE/L43A